MGLSMGMSQTEIHRRQVDLALKRFFSTSPQWRGLRRAHPLVFDAVGGFFKDGGKRVRAILFRQTYLGYGGRDLELLDTVSIALELLHGFILVHDDIIDKSALRREKPALHRAFDALLAGSAKGGSALKGEDLAIVAGDLMYALAIDLIQGSPASDRVKGEAMGLVARTALQTGQGELLDMLEELSPFGDDGARRMLELYDLKTARYTFCCPMALGAVFAEAPAADVEALTRMGSMLGVAYQMRDDIADLEEDCGFGKTSRLAKTQRKKTILLMWAYEASDRRGKELIRSHMDRRKPAGASGLASFKNIVEASGAVKKAERRIALLKGRAFRVLDTLSLDECSRKGIRRHLDSLI